MRAAALYLRSSKDRSDVSIAAQRHALTEFAATKQIPIVAEYADAVESGKDEDRPGFQRLLRDLKAKDRSWNVILAYDTSRIARRRYITQALGHEARKLGVTILYAMVPEVDPISTVILESVLQAMDEVHSLMSREKGLAGMAENVRRGWRAGGRAPLGYRLERVATSAIRKGEAVMKSRLVLADDAPAIAAYLKGRALGQNGSALHRRHGLTCSRSSLVDAEWNALTYAGHTVWNMRRPKDSQADGSRKPRSEWQIQRDTHPALITDAEAELLLTRLEAGRPTSRHRGSDYILSGLLHTPAGKPWHGNRGNYCTAGGWIPKAELERVVLERLAGDFASPAIVKAFTREAQRLQEGMVDVAELERARADRADAEKRMARLTASIERMEDPTPLLKRLDEVEKERRAAAERVLRAEDQLAQSRVLETITEADVRQILADLATNMAALDRATLKDALRAWLEKIELDPASRQGRMLYRITVNPVMLASPQRSTDNRPALRAVGRLFQLGRPRGIVRRAPALRDLAT